MRLMLCVLSLWLSLLAGCGSRPATTLKIDPALLKLVPADTLTLFGVKVDQLRSTPVYRKFGSRLDSSWAPAFENQTGLDPRRNVREILAILRQEHSLLLARGEFDPAAAGSERRFHYKGHTLIGTEQAAVTYLDAHTAAAGHAPAIRQLLDQRGQAQGPSPALLSVMSNIPAGSQIWVASTAGASAAAARVPEQAQAAQLVQFLGGVRAYYGGLSLHNGLSMEGKVECATAADAGNLELTAKGLVGLGRLNATGNQPDLLRFFDGIRIEREKADVRIRIEAPETGLEQAIEMMTNYGSEAGVTPSLPDFLK